MSVEWMDLQEHYMRNQGIDKAGYIWGAAIVECFLKNVAEVWDTRNEDVHGKNKTEKQHRRKQKLAEQIRDLQKEKEYARPRDDDIFPEDPEQFIEQSSTNHLANWLRIRYIDQRFSTARKEQKKLCHNISNE